MDFFSVQHLDSRCDDDQKYTALEIPTHSVNKIRVHIQNKIKTPSITCNLFHDEFHEVELMTLTERR
jgi:hypothetical protein